jgi:hypothetical protein
VKIQQRTTRVLKYERHARTGDDPDEPKINTTVEHSTLEAGETALEHWNKLVERHKKYYSNSSTIGPIWWFEETISITRSWSSEEVLNAKSRSRNPET